MVLHTLFELSNQFYFDVTAGWMIKLGHKDFYTINEIYFKIDSYLLIASFLYFEVFRTYTNQEVVSFLITKKGYCMVWYMVWYGMAWHGLVCYSIV